MIDVADTDAVKREAERRRQLLERGVRTFAGVVREPSFTTTEEDVERFVAVGPIPFPPMPAAPIRLTLPWAWLVSDNAKYGVLEGRIALRPKYRTAKKACAREVARQLRGRAPLAVPCRLVVTLHEPQRERARDLTNYAKLLHDALTGGGAYADDSLLDRVEYVRGAVDAANPRVELTLTPLEDAA